MKAHQEDLQVEEVDLQAEDVVVQEEMDMTQEMETEEDEDDATSSSSENPREVSPLKTGPMDPENDGCPRRRQPPR